MSICKSCLRALRLQQIRTEFQSNPSLRSTTRTTVASTTARRTFSHSLLRLNENESQPKQTTTSSSSSDPLKSFASSLRQTKPLRSTTEPYIAYSSTSTLFAECSKQITYTIPSRNATPTSPTPQTASGEECGEGEGWWLRPKSEGGLGLDVTFNTWAQVLFLYMYMLTVRLRCFPAEHARIWHQQLLDHFFYAAEDRMVVWHGLESRGARNKYLKDLWLQWRGVMLSYDEGLIKGDAVLAAAIWRNVFKAYEGVDLADLALVSAFLREQLKMLDALSDQDIGEGRVQFGDPGALRGVVGTESEWMRKEIKPEELKGLEEKTST